jgi:uncharacterized phiE125 gp8 family phage protein
MISIISRDEFALANELLPAAKQYMRIFHCDEDPGIALLIGAAMGQFERTRGMTLFPTQYLWTVEGDFIDGAINVTPEQRITPISLWTAAADAGDVSAQYSLAQTGLHGAVFYSLKGEAQSGLALTITAGYASADLIPASIAELIFRLTSTYYEYREKFTPGNLERHPDWDNQEMAGFWVPRV